jgi:tRNA A37 threonylcarbamoyladenosine dehydratase
MMTWHDGMSANDYLEVMLSRQLPLVGEEGMNRLREATVAHAGLGGGGA